MSIYPEPSMLYNLEFSKTYYILLEIYSKIDYLERKYVLSVIILLLSVSFSLPLAFSLLTSYPVLI